jgi:hypothetical protein
MAEKSVRPAKPEDAAAVGELVRAAYSTYVGRMGKEPAPMLEDYAALIRDGVVWVLDEGREVLGALVMRSASPRRSSNDSFRCSHTPAWCHSFRRRQQVMPEPQPIS